MSKSIKEITGIIDAFVAERNWDNSNPSQLITSIIIEMGELAEHYQWKNKVPKFNAEQKQIVGYEFVDVVFFLFKLASESGIDIEAAFDDKIKRLAVKYPIGADTDKQHDLYRRTGKNKKYE